MADTFTVVLRGYDRAQVDAAIGRADAALSSGSETMRASARADLAGQAFDRVLRGYDTREVDRALTELLGGLGP
ncbi:DivIVA domain-containing protein [Couchioplanes caeruleus]|uniref:DivIVA domain-containing protein n=1 Tax=Couchioplanes caeruleus TaxID=56438 RepID=UPI0020C17855|nr:DivIVA domain-containing protein [Couchioplanes caeruleus]UQU62441.1 DivIVA domain-containing protein [Couchioplanes caeruleus]